MSEGFQKLLENEFRKKTKKLAKCFTAKANIS